jgi:DNA-directed RNA polymerase subunit alpha
MTQKGLLKDIMLPNEIKYEKNSYTPFYGKFNIYPFEKGVGVTIANSLRRVLLSAIPGYAITSIKVEGINHEFESIKGVKEDLTDIILAIKKIRLNLNDSSEKKVIRINKAGKGELFAKDFAVDATVEVINGDLKIATLNDEANLVIDIQIELGRGYRSAEDLFDSNSVISVIPVDAIFSPVARVNYSIDDFRVGEKTDCEKVVLEIWTSGAISPSDAVSKAAAILKKYFSLFMDFEPEDEIVEAGEASEASVSSDILSKPITELELSVRSYNCLKSSNINTIGELMQYDKDALMKIKNFGKKSLTEIAEKLQIYGLSLGDKTDGDDLDSDADEDMEDIEEGE